PNRKQNTQAGIDKLARPFVRAMDERDVTPSALRNLRRYHLDLLARLIQSNHDDPDFKDPQNPWLALIRAGILAAYRSNRSEDEARLIDTAFQAGWDPEGFEWLVKASEMGMMK